MDKTDAHIMRQKRMNALLDKEDFDHKDYEELWSLISEMEKEYYELKKRFQKAAEEI